MKSGEPKAASAARPDHGVVEFADVRLDLNRFELHRSGVAQRVEPQVLEVLAYLIRHRDRLVTKQELMDEVWGDRFVSDSAITSRIKAARRVTGDDGDRQQVIRTIHGRGYRFVGVVTSSTARSPDPGLCVGRDEELAVLASALATARAGRRQVVLVSGEPGIGKTTLLDAFLASGTTDGVAVGFGQCHPTGGGEAYGPVLEALTDLAAGQAGSELRRHLDELAPAWMLQLPGLVDAAHAASLATRTLGATPERMLREALSLLDAVGSSGRAPLVLLFEDLQWGDRATLGLLVAIARRRNPAPLLVVGSYRQAELDDPYLNTTLAELVVRGLATHVRLEPLSVDAVTELVSRRAGTDSVPAVEEMAALHRRSGGNPLYVGALLEAAADPTNPNRLPGSLRDLVERHLDRLDPTDRALVDAAAVVGTDFVPELLGADPRHAAARCEALARRHQLIVEDERAGPGHYRFRHGLYQEVAYSCVPRSRLPVLHQAVGERLENASEAPSAVELAEHFTKAGDTLRAARYRLEAARTAAGRMAPGEAMTHLARGLELIPDLPTDRHRMQFEADLLASMAAMTISVEGFASPSAEDNLRRARDLYLQLDDGPAAYRATYSLAGLYEYRGEFDRSRDLMERRLHIAVEDDGALVEMHEILACSTFHLGRFGEALRHAEEALARYDVARDRVALAAAGENPFVSSQHWAAYSLWFIGQPDSALARSEAAVRLARRRDHAFSLCHALEQAAVLRQFRREPDQVLSLAEELHALAVEGGLPYRQATAGLLLHWARGVTGDPATSCAELQASLAAYRRTGVAMDLPYFLTLLAEVALLADRAATADDALTEARALASTRTTFVGAELDRLTARLLLHTGHDRRAVETHLRSALADAKANGALSLELRAAADLRRLQLGTGEPADAEQVLLSVVEMFNEGRETTDLQDAIALLPPERFEQLRTTPSIADQHP